MIISGGVNVYPQEAENVLVTHPKVVDVAVFGVPNEDFGEEVKAVVQPVEMPADDDDADALAEELIAFCRSQLADVKCPRSIDFRAVLPRHPTGKLYKRQLKDEYWARTGTSGGGLEGADPGAERGVGEPPERHAVLTDAGADRGALPVEQDPDEALVGDDVAIGRLIGFRPAPLAVAAERVAVVDLARDRTCSCHVPPLRRPSASASISGSRSAR